MTKTQSDQNLPLKDTALRSWWRAAIAPVLHVIAARRVAAVGATTLAEELVGYCRAVDGRLDVIGPDWGSVCWQEDECPPVTTDHVRRHLDTDLNVLWRLDDLDAVVIDGDPNWYHVFHALTLIAQTSIQSGHRFPLVFLHGIGWPYGRRDGYADPEQIPEGFRQPWRRPGDLSDGSDLTAHGMLYPDYCYAHAEGSIQNGVLTAAEDALAQFAPTLALRLLELPGWNGLALIYPAEREQNPDFAHLLAQLRPSPLQRELIDALDTARSQANWYAISERQEITAHETALEDAREQIAEREAEQDTLATRLTEIEQARETLANQVGQGEARQATLTARLAEIEQVRNHLATQVRHGEAERAALVLERQTVEQARDALIERMRQDKRAHAALATRLRESDQKRVMLVMRMRESDQKRVALVAKLRESEQKRTGLVAKLRESEQKRSALAEQAAKLRESDQKRVMLVMRMRESDQKRVALVAKLRESEQKRSALAEQAAKLRESDQKRVALVAKLRESEQKCSALAEQAAKLRESEQKCVALAKKLRAIEQMHKRSMAQWNADQASQASKQAKLAKLPVLPDPQITVQTQRLQEIERILAAKTQVLRQYIHLTEQLQEHFQATLQSWRWRLGNRIIRVIELLLGRRQIHLAVDEMQALFERCEHLRQNETNVIIAARQMAPSSSSAVSDPAVNLWSDAEHDTRPRLLLMPQRRGDKAPAATAHVRLLRPCFAPTLTQHWQVAVWPNGTLPAPGVADVLVIQREAADVDIQTLGNWIGPWREAGGRLIYELDDDLFDQDALAQRRHRVGDDSFAEYIRWLTLQADVVTVSTEPLAEIIRPINAKVVVIPNALDAKLWQLHHNVSRTIHKPRSVVRIGYIGTRTHDQDLAIVTAALRRIEAEYGDTVVIEVIGACQNRKSPFGKTVALPHKTDYPNFVRWLLGQVKWDIGLIPLHQDRFNRSKSHLKFLEYAALNFAIVCSDVPAYAGIARHEVNALVVSADESAWYESIKKLIDNADLRKRLAETARAEVRECLTLESIVPHWLRLLNSLRSLDQSNYSPFADISLGFSATLTRITRNPLPLAIVIPVYNAPNELRDCLDAVLRQTQGAYRLIVIDDASPDSNIAPLLDEYGRRTSIEIHRNLQNLGFSRTVNLGIELAGRADVILLNADTQVTPGWLRNLRLAAYSGDRVATATPFSNNAGAFSAPEIGQANPLPDGFTLDAYARAVTRQAQRTYPHTPTGNGFCLYLRRDALDEIGNFDATAFPRGYGEENDLCMRAVRLGWTHVVDDATFIFHVRSASFGAAKTDLMTQGRAIVDQRYPEYRRAVADFIGSRELLDAHQRIRRIPKDWPPTATIIRPRLLFVVSTRTGGVPQTNRDLMRSIQGQVETLVLQGDPRQVQLLRFDGLEFTELACEPLTPPLKAFPHRSTDYDRIVADWLVKYAVEAIHIRHIAWHGFGLADVAKGLGIPVIFSIHDFYPVCPTVNLIDDEQHFCAGQCTSGPGDCPRPLWREADFPLLKQAAIKDWRRQFAVFLDQCSSFVTTSESTRQLLVEHYPALGAADFWVIPHGRDFAGFEQMAASLNPKSPIRLLIPGNLGIAKGAGILGDLGRLAVDAGVEIHVLGKVSPEIKKQAGKLIHWHGPYARDEFADRVRAIRPHLGGVFSIWPETYCHTLTELWACGLPVIGFDLGAVGERIRESGCGWLTSALTAPSILETISVLRTHPGRFTQALDAVIAWQNGVGKERNGAWMAKRYTDIYRHVVSLPQPDPYDSGIRDG